MEKEFILRTREFLYDCIAMVPMKDCILFYFIEKDNTLHYVPVYSVFASFEATAKTYSGYRETRCVSSYNLPKLDGYQSFPDFIKIVENSDKCILKLGNYEKYGLTRLGASADYPQERKVLGRWSQVDKVLLGLNFKNRLFG